MARKDWSRVEGLGGGMYTSAGGISIVYGGIDLTFNEAASSGGGIGVKSAKTLFLPYQGQQVLIKQNKALGNAASESGNGGGVYATSALLEGDGFAATLYDDDGTVQNLDDTPLVLIQANEANRWGGGLYAGKPYELQGDNLRTAIILKNTRMERNSAYGGVADGAVVLFPSQIAAQKVGISDTRTINFDGAWIEGTSLQTDIGIYRSQSNPFLGIPNFFFLYINELAQ